MSVENVSRRGFLGTLVSGGAPVLGIGLGGSRDARADDGLPDLKADRAPLHPSVYLGIDTDGTVYIVEHRSEMGGGIRTSLPMILADELAADSERVRVELLGAPASGRACPHPAARLATANSLRTPRAFPCPRRATCGSSRARPGAT